MWFTILMCIWIAASLWLALTYITRELKKEDEREKFIDQLMKNKQSH